jgi:hypothetical protein
LSGIFHIENIECRKPFWNQNPDLGLKVCQFFSGLISKYGNVVMFRSWGGFVNVFINEPDDISFILSANTPIERFGKDPLATAQFQDFLGKRFHATPTPFIVSAH